jgi:hypothetical protein
MVLMCHISHHRYREANWPRDRWSWIDEVDEPEAADTTVAAPAGATRDPDLRVSQAERDEVAGALARHFADGRLTVEEYEERVEAALAARTGRDLEPLLSDLPADPPHDPVRPAAPRPRQRTRRASVGFPSARVLAIAAVVVLAIYTGLWALWLLWPALVLTRGCGIGYRYRGVAASRESGRASDRPPVVERL